MYGPRQRSAWNISRSIHPNDAQWAHAIAREKEFTHRVTEKEEEQLFFLHGDVESTFFIFFFCRAPAVMGVKRSQPSANGRENEERKQQTVNIL